MSKFKNWCLLGFMSNSRSATIVLFTTVFIDLIGFGMIIPLIPYLGRELSDSPLKAGLLMAIYSLMQFIINPFWGQLSDKYGRRPILLLSLCGASLSHLFFAFSSTFWMLFFARMFAGIFGANISVAMAAMADLSDAKGRSQKMGLIGAAFGLGFTLGPFFGGGLGYLGNSISSTAPFGVQTAALGASLVCMLNFILGCFRLPETLNQEAQHPTSLSLVQRLKNVLLYFKNPLINKLLAIYGMNTLAMALIEISLFLFVKDRFDLDLIQASFGFAYIGLILVFTQGYLIRKLLPKYGEHRLIVFGLGLFIIGSAGIAFSFHILVLGFFVSILSLGQGLLSPALTGSISLSESSEHQGQIMGVTQSLSALGRILGPVSAGAIYKFSYTGPFLISASLAALAWILFTFIQKTTKPNP